MPNYNQQHPYYCGVDLHARSLFIMGVPLEVGIYLCYGIRPLPGPEATFMATGTFEYRTDAERKTIERAASGVRRGRLRGRPRDLADRLAEHALAAWRVKPDCTTRFARRKSCFGN